VSERTKNLRNVGIILALALVVWGVPGGARTGAGIENVLSVVLFAGLAFFAYRLYMEHRMTLLDLPDDQRVLLYGSVTLAIVALLCTTRMWNTEGFWIVVWFAMIGVAAAGLMTVARRRNEY
jgi:hypothetical protein